MLVLCISPCRIYSNCHTGSQTLYGPTADVHYHISAPVYRNIDDTEPVTSGIRFLCILYERHNPNIPKPRNNISSPFKTIALITKPSPAAVRNAPISRIAHKAELSYAYRAHAAYVIEEPLFHAPLPFSSMAFRIGHLSVDRLLLQRFTMSFKTLCMP